MKVYRIQWKDEINPECGYRREYFRRPSDAQKRADALEKEFGDDTWFDGVSIFTFEVPVTARGILDALNRYTAGS